MIPSRYLTGSSSDRQVDEEFLPAIDWMESQVPSPVLTKRAQPVFVLAAGPCSGVEEISRALQGEINLCNEPFEKGSLLKSIKLQCIALFKMNQKTETAHHGVSSQIAESIGAFFHSIFQPLNSNATVLRWGACEFRWGLLEARLFRWVYPEAKFLLVIRHPVEAYREFHSRKAFGELQSGLRLTVTSFSRHWRSQSKAFSVLSQTQNVLALKYEDLQNEEALIQIRKHLMVKFSEPPSTRDLPSKDSLPFTHIDEVARYTNEELDKWGYKIDEVSSTEERPVFPSTAGAGEPLFLSSGRRSVVFVRMLSNSGRAASEDTLRQLEKLGILVERLYGLSAIDAGRSSAVSRAFARNATELIWVDSNVHFSLQDVIQVQRHNAPVVGAVLPNIPTGWWEPANSLVPNENGLVQVDYLSFAFLCTKSHIYQDVRKRLHLPLCNQLANEGSGFLPFFLPMVTEDQPPRYLADDLAFMYRLKQCGLPIYLDPTVRLGVEHSSVTRIDNRNRTK